MFCGKSVGPKLCATGKGVFMIVGVEGMGVSVSVIEVGDSVDWIAMVVGVDVGFSEVVQPLMIIEKAKKTKNIFDISFLQF